MLGLCYRQGGPLLPELGSVSVGTNSLLSWINPCQELPWERAEPQDGIWVGWTPRLLETSERENLGAASSSCISPGISGQGGGLGSRALLEGMRKMRDLCSILMCIPLLSSHFPHSGQKHGDSGIILQVLRVTKTQVIITQAPGCVTAHRGQGLCSAEGRRSRGSSGITSFCGHSLPPEIQGLTCFSLRLTKKPPCNIFIQGQQR